MVFAPRLTVQQNRAMKTAQELRLIFAYDPQTGNLLQHGKRAGYIMGTGYRLLSVNKKRIYAHRLIWCLVTGEWPTLEIDHINRDKSDNRWTNLRLASRQDNARNQSITAKNTSGFKGVSFHKRTGKWRADIKVEDSQKSLGSFTTPEQASLAYREAAMKYFGAFATL